MVKKKQTGKKRKKPQAQKQPGKQTEQEEVKEEEAKEEEAKEEEAKEDEAKEEKGKEEEEEPEEEPLVTTEKGTSHFNRTKEFWRRVTKKDQEMEAEHSLRLTEVKKKNRNAAPNEKSKSEAEHKQYVSSRWAKFEKVVIPNAEASLDAITKEDYNDPSAMDDFFVKYPWERKRQLFTEADFRREGAQDLTANHLKEWEKAFLSKHKRDPMAEQYVDIERFKHEHNIYRVLSISDEEQRDLDRDLLLNEPYNDTDFESDEEIEDYAADYSAKCYSVFSNWASGLHFRILSEESEIHRRMLRDSIVYDHFSANTTRDTQLSYLETIDMLKTAADEMDTLYNLIANVIKLAHEKNQVTITMAVTYGNEGSESTMMKELSEMLRMSRCEMFYRRKHYNNFERYYKEYTKFRGILETMKAAYEAALIFVYDSITTGMKRYNELRRSKHIDLDDKTVITFKPKNLYFESYRNWYIGMTKNGTNFNENLPEPDDATNTVTTNRDRYLGYLEDAYVTIDNLESVYMRFDHLGRFADLCFLDFAVDYEARKEYNMSGALSYKKEKEANQKEWAWWRVECYDVWSAKLKTHIISSKDWMIEYFNDLHKKPEENHEDCDTCNALIKSSIENVNTTFTLYDKTIKGSFVKFDKMFPKWEEYILDNGDALRKTYLETTVSFELDRLTEEQRAKLTEEQKAKLTEELRKKEKKREEQKAKQLDQYSATVIKAYKEVLDSSLKNPLEEGEVALGIDALFFLWYTSYLLKIVQIKSEFKEAVRKHKNDDDGAASAKLHSDQLKKLTTEKRTHAIAEYKYAFLKEIGEELQSTRIDGRSIPEHTGEYKDFIEEVLAAEKGMKAHSSEKSRYLTGKVNEFQSLDSIMKKENPSVLKAKESNGVHGGEVNAHIMQKKSMIVEYTSKRSSRMLEKQGEKQEKGDSKKSSLADQPKPPVTELDLCYDDSEEELRKTRSEATGVLDKIKKEAQEYVAAKFPRIGTKKVFTAKDISTLLSAHDTTIQKDYTNKDVDRLKKLRRKIDDIKAWKEELGYAEDQDLDTYDNVVESNVPHKEYRAVRTSLKQWIEALRKARHGDIIEWTKTKVPDKSVECIAFQNKRLEFANKASEKVKNEHGKLVKAVDDLEKKRNGIEEALREVSGIHKMYKERIDEERRKMKEADEEELRKKEKKLEEQRRKMEEADEEELRKKEKKLEEQRRKEQQAAAEKRAAKEKKQQAVAEKRAAKKKKRLEERLEESKKTTREKAKELGAAELRRHYILDLNAVGDDETPSAMVATLGDVRDQKRDELAGRAGGELREADIWALEKELEDYEEELAEDMKFTLRRLNKLKKDKSALFTKLDRMDNLDALRSEEQRYKVTLEKVKQDLHNKGIQDPYDFTTRVVRAREDEKREEEHDEQDDEEEEEEIEDQDEPEEKIEDQDKPEEKIEDQDEPEDVYDALLTRLTGTSTARARTVSDWGDTADQRLKTRMRIAAQRVVDKIAERIDKPLHAIYPLIGERFRPAYLRNLRANMQRIRHSDDLNITDKSQPDFQQQVKGYGPIALKTASEAIYYTNEAVDKYIKKKLPLRLKARILDDRLKYMTRYFGKQSDEIESMKKDLATIAGCDNKIRVSFGSDAWRDPHNVYEGTPTDEKIAAMKDGIEQGEALLRSLIAGLERWNKTKFETDKVNFDSEHPLQNSKLERYAFSDEAPQFSESDFPFTPSRAGEPSGRGESSGSSESPAPAPSSAAASSSDAAFSNPATGWTAEMSRAREYLLTYGRRTPEQLFVMMDSGQYNEKTGKTILRLARQKGFQG